MKNHTEPGMNLVEMFLNNTTTRSISISVLVGIAGWTAHALMDAAGQARTLDEHTQQLQKLWESQEKTHKDLQDLTLGVVKVDAKLDVLNQKFDDNQRLQAINDARSSTRR